MSARSSMVVGFLVITLGVAAQASAGWFFGIFDGLARDFKARNNWPNQYTCADKASVRAPFTCMVANGWQKQNLLGASHFDAAGQLTDAGRVKLRWIVTSAPRQHRVVYVLKADTNEATVARITTVVQAAGQIAPNDLPPVLPSAMSGTGFSGEQVDAIGRSFQKSTQPPRLPYLQSSGSSGGSSGGNP